MHQTYIFKLNWIYRGSHDGISDARNNYDNDFKHEIKGGDFEDCLYILGNLELFSTTRVR